MDTKKPAIKQVFYLIDPFEVREVLQGEDVIVFKHDKLSQSLWSQGGAASEYKADDGKFYLSQSLWSQGGAARQYAHAKRVRVSLNPFEVREVLQVTWTIKNLKKQVSIPLKSGRCCKKYFICKQ